MKPKILLVDDEPRVLDGYRRNLRKRYDISTAHDNDMETLTRLAEDHLLDPVVMTTAAMATVALLSGALARVVEFAQGAHSIRPRRRTLG